MKHSSLDRRSFLKMSLMGGAALAAPWSANRTQAAVAAPAAAAPAAAPGPPSRVAVTVGEDRADLAFQALKPFSKEVAAAIGDKRVVIKPNTTSNTRQLASTDAKNLEGILEFLKSIGKDKNVVITESPGGGTAMSAFSNFGFIPLADKYGAKLFEQDKDDFETLYCFDDRDFRPHPCRMAKILLDPNNFIISAAKLKTHDRVIATLSLKNIVVGAPIKRAGGDRPGGGRWTNSDKSITHGGGIRGTNFNMFLLASRLHPHLAINDGYEGMEGDGPISGTPVASRVCVASMDWLVADRVGVELMGIDFAKVGYLNYCAQAGMGEGDLSKIEILGPALKDYIKPYKLHRGIEQQLIWMQPVANG